MYFGSSRKVVKKILKISNFKKKYLYLISPNKIKKDFYFNLNKIFAFKKVKFFQLRLKNNSLKKKLKLVKKLNQFVKNIMLNF